MRVNTWQDQACRGRGEAATLVKEKCRDRCINPLREGVKWEGNEAIILREFDRLHYKMKKIRGLIGED